MKFEDSECSMKTVRACKSRKQLLPSLVVLSSHHQNLCKPPLVQAYEGSQLNLACPQIMISSSYSSSASAFSLSARPSSSFVSRILKRAILKMGVPCQEAQEIVTAKGVHDHQVAAVGPLTASKAGGARALQCQPIGQDDAARV